MDLSKWLILSSLHMQFALQEVGALRNPHSTTHQKEFHHMEMSFLVTADGSPIAAAVSKAGHDVSLFSEGS